MDNISLNDVQSLSNNETNERCIINNIKKEVEGEDQANKGKSKLQNEIVILQNIKLETFGSNVTTNNTNTQVTENDYEMDVETNCRLDVNKKKDLEVNITSPNVSDSRNNSNDKSLLTEQTNVDLTSSSSIESRVFHDSEALPSSINEQMNNTLSDVSTHSVLNSVVKYVNDSNDTSNDFSTIVSTNVNIMNSSLSQLVDYGETDSDETSASSDFSDSNNENDANEMCNMISTEFIAFKNNTFRDINQSEGTYTETDSSSSSSSDSDDSDIAICTDNVKPPAVNKDKEETPRTKGELRLCDLPPIENLHISVPQQECIEIGSVMSIVEELVVIQALPNMPPLDVDTVLFLNKGETALGRIFDVLGQVNEPCYTVRFNKAEDIPERGITPGTKVYCAPRTEHTSYVLVADLMKLKGSDASWKEDNEPPETCIDYSDDEAEQQARRGKRNRNHRPLQSPIATTSFTRRETEPHPTDYEKRMNERNLQMNARYNTTVAPTNTTTLAPTTPAPQGWGNIPPQQQVWRFAPMRDVRQQSSVWYNYGPIGRPSLAQFHPYADQQGCNNRFLRSPVFHGVPGSNAMYLPPMPLQRPARFTGMQVFDAARVPPPQGVCMFPRPPPPPPPPSSTQQQMPHGQ